MQNKMIQFAKLNEKAFIPRRSHQFDAGMDLSACEDAVVPAHGQAIVDTGIAVSFPLNHYARVAPRSGLAAKHSIDVLAGVIDYGYTSSIKVIMYNHSGSDFPVSCGDRIAQLIFEMAYIPSDEAVKEVHHSELMKTLEAATRGLAGFGSTGI